MGLSESVSSLFSGNLTDAFNYLWVPSDEVQRSNQLDSKLQQFIADDYARGLIDAQQAQEAYGRIAQNAFQPGGFFDQEGTSPWEGFKEGAQEGADNIRKVTGGAISTAMGLGLRIIPWQVWVILGLIVIVWLAPFWRPFAAKWAQGAAK